MEGYDHKKIEAKWRAKWEQEQPWRADDASDKPKYYTLIEFPYPSGNLHVGHWYAFSVPDMFARYQRMKGFNVLYPIGFDAFGLPAENAAIKNNLNPREWTFGNIDYMREQLKTMGASFDWSREVITADPSYYTWTQWLFIQFFNKGLAYQKDTEVNWCPSCKTVLANEQVIAGKCERCGTDVEKRLMKQWNLKITDYAPRLLSDLETVSYPEPIKEAQRNWIGQSHGAQIKFEIRNSKSETEDSVEVFTTRPDTLFGATYMVLAPEHQLIQKIEERIKNKDEVKKYIKETAKKAEIDRIAEGKEKTGVQLEGISAINPATKEEIPIFIADYVLASYGTGAIMAVPAHDERDYEFAKKFNLPIREVITPLFGKYVGEEGRRDVVKAVIIKEGKVLLVKNAGRLMLPGGSYEAGEDDHTALGREITEETGYKDFLIGEYLGKAEFSYYSKTHQIDRMRGVVAYVVDIGKQSLVSHKNEQEEGEESVWVDIQIAIKESPEGLFVERAFLGKPLLYAGDGILVNSGEFDGVSSIDAKEKITKSVGGKMTTTYRMRDWVVSRQRYWGCPIPIIHCETCGAQPVPEKDLPVILPEIQDYLPTGNGESPLAKAEEWVNTTCPKCGKSAKRETDTLDTFIDSSWYFLRYVDPHNEKEFASKEKQKLWMPVDFYSGGAEHTTMHLLYSRFFHKVLFDLHLVTDAEPYQRRMNRGIILGPDGNKMSKSHGNVIDPDAYVATLGADTVRMYLAFIGPYNEVGAYPWSPDSIVGVRRFLERVNKLALRIGDGKLSPDAHRILHETLKKVGEEIESFKFNTAVSAFMICLNALEKEAIVPKEAFEMLVKALAPFAPFLSEELWETLGHTNSVHMEPWPSYDEASLAKKEIYVIMQVDGKVRGKILTRPGVTQEDVLALIYKDKKLSGYLGDGKPEKVIFVPDRLISIVLPKP